MTTLHPQQKLVKTRSCIVFAAAAIALASADTTHGQYALGAGDALDANPSRVTGRTNQPAAVTDYRSRNLTVTGDVAGGRAFRGDVGYTADGGFRGALASDDLFRFRADSAFSSPTSIATMPDQFRFGQHLGVLEYRRDTLSAPPSQVPGLDSQLRSLDMTEGAIVDRIRMDQMTRGATSAERTLFEGSSRTVGTVLDEQGTPYFIEASSLQGIGYRSAVERHRTQGLTVLDRIRLREDMATGRVTDFGSPIEWRFEQLAEQERLAEHRPSQQDRRLPEFSQTDLRDDRRPSDGVDTRFDPRQPGFDTDPRERDRLGLGRPDQRQTVVREQDVRHQQIIERIARRYADADDVELQIDPQVLRQLDDEFARLRDRLSHRDPSVVAQTEEPDATPEDETDPEADRPQRPELPGLHLDPDQAVPLLRHGQRVEQLTGAERTRFNELMEMAEQNLRDGEYFMAERQFLRALRFHPGEPMATAGMAHSQVGAGLYIAASLTLQRLFATNPEMIDVRYAPALLPSRARLVQVVESLETRLSQRRDRDAVAFLLAYIGHQLEDPAMVQRGLTVMQELRPEDDLLLTLLQGVWQGVEPAGK